MTTVRFAHVLKSERHYDLNTTKRCDKWSIYVRSYKVKPGQGITV